jgi:hypothetical protein
MSCQPQNIAIWMSTTQYVVVEESGAEQESARGRSIAAATFQTKLNDFSGIKIYGGVPAGRSAHHQF